ncbi:MAG: lipopolysaccharide biosynthesis protein [Solobacterium sp.]|nr:lipopolysaccharide biosynthesis protein [Solobacterium sp.]
MSEDGIKRKSIKGFAWQILQNGSSYMIRLVVSVILAREIGPSGYGLVGLVNTFINIALVFVTTGFASAIVQKQEITEEDLSTLFLSGMGLGILLYGILYAAAPTVAAFYEQPMLVDLMRVNGLIVILGMCFSVQQALINRNMEFHISFRTNLCGAVVMAITGLWMVYHGFGVWSIVFSSIASYMTNAVLLWLAVKWKPKPVFSVIALRENLPFSTKVLGIGLIDALYNNLQSLIIGKVYSTEALAYYNKGYQFPSMIMTIVDGASANVMFSALSKFQDNWERGLAAMRREVNIIHFATMPVLLGMAGTADTLILLLLGDEWAGSVPFLRMCCIICMFWPNSVKLHALNAQGKSGIALISKTTFNAVTLICLLATYRISVYAMVASGILAQCINWILMAVIAQKHLGYRVSAQFNDVFRSLLISSVMAGFVMYVGTLLHTGLLIKLVVQTLTGIVMYAALSWIFNQKTLRELGAFAGELLHLS